MSKPAMPDVNPAGIILEETMLTASLHQVARAPTRTQGRLNTLTSEQSAAFDSFKQRIEASGDYRPASEGQGASHDDVTLLRFLRARKFDVQGAFTQFTNTENWRKAERVDQLYDEFPTDEFCDSQEVYTQFTGRRSKGGQPLYVYRITSLTKERINRYSSQPDRLEPRMIALTEMMTAFTLPLCTALPRPEPEVPIDSTVCIVDVSNVSLTRFWQLKGHMQRASVMASAAYPETLGAIYLVGAPSFFSTVWKWVRAWFDPGTVEKIFILASHEVLPTLTQYIDPSNIPKRYGGSLDWDFGDPVNLDKEAQQLLGLDHLPRGPVRFSVKDGFKMVGSDRTEQDLKEANMVSKHVKEELATNGGLDSAAAAASTAQQSSSKDRAADAPETSSSETSGPPTTEAHGTATSPSPATEQGRIEEAAAAAAARGATVPVPLAVAVASSAAVAAEVAPTPTSPANGSAEPESTAAQGEHEHSIADAAREHPEAPIKDLAAALEGTTL